MAFYKNYKSKNIELLLYKNSKSNSKSYCSIGNIRSYITFINQQTHHFAAHRKRLISIPEDVKSENTESLIMQNSNTEQSIDIIVDRCDSESFVEFSYGEDLGPQYSNKLLVP